MNTRPSAWVCAASEDKMQIDHYKTHIYQNWKLVYPIMLSQLSHMILGITDSIMVGHVGTTSLAAAALANAIFNVIFLFGVGVSLSLTPLVASSKGTNNPLRIIGILRHGLAINIINSLLLMGIIFLCKEILWYLHQPEEVVRIAIPYLLILAFSLLPILVFQTFRQFLEGLSETKTPMIIMLSGVVLNIALNYLLIYGYAGFPAMGLEGAGWGSLLSRIAMALAIVLYIYYSAPFIIYRASFAIGNYSRKLFGQILHIGIPMGTQFIFEVAAFDFSAIMMGWLGAKTLAAHQIAINLAYLSYMTATGVAIATTIRVSNEWGQKNIVALKESFSVLLSIALLFVVVWGALFILGRNVLPMLYVEDSDVIRIATPLVMIAGLFQLSDGVQVVCIGALRGLQDVKIPSLLIFVAYWVIGLPLGYWLGFEAGYGGTGIWWGLLTGLTLTAVVMFVRFKALVKRL